MSETFRITGLVVLLLYLGLLLAGAKPSVDVLLVGILCSLKADLLELKAQPKERK